MTRRRALALGAGGVTVVVGGGLVWRAWDNGVLAAGTGPAYRPWRRWREDRVEGPLALVQAAILAANAHNTQPWRFRVGDALIELQADHDRHLGSFDPFRREMYLSLGCALENMAQAASGLGYEVGITGTPGRLGLKATAAGAELAAVVDLAAREVAPGALAHAIAARHTHRGAYLADRRVPGEALAQLRALAQDEPEVRLFLLDQGRERLGELIVAATARIIADHEMAADSARWFRLDWSAVQRHRDGVTIDGFGLPPVLNAAVKILPAPSPEEVDRQWLDATRDVHVATAPLLGMIAVRDLYDRPTALAAGRLWQRLHLWCAAQGLAAQPLNQPVEMVDRERELGLPATTAAALAELVGEPGWHPTFVFRAGYAARPARMSPRRPLDAVLV